MNGTQQISIVILTYNRKDLLRELLRSLSKIEYRPLEVIVVDNCSDEPVSQVTDDFPSVKLLQMERNVGVAGRNRGISYASGEIIITLDDDIIGVDDAAILKIIEIFRDDKIGAVCFKVLDTENKVTNWCHHCLAEEYAEKTFITNEITEGAIAFRKSVLKSAGLYPDTFFISHEGPDLACRIMNKGYFIIYNPQVVVKHYHSRSARKNWRRYYFDTRNLLWLVVRNYPLAYGMKTLFIGLSAMLVYSIRDGFLIYWLKGVFHGFMGLRAAYDARSPMTRETYKLVRDIDKMRPGFFIMLRKRLFQREVRI